MEYSAYYKGERLGTFVWDARASIFDLTVGPQHAWFYEAVTRAWEDCHNPLLPYDGEAAERAFQAFEQYCADVEVRDATGRVMPGASVTLFSGYSRPSGHTFQAQLGIPWGPKRPAWLPIKLSGQTAARGAGGEPERSSIHVSSHAGAPSAQSAWSVKPEARLMECLVLHGAASVGRVVLDWSRASPPEPPLGGPVLVAELEPTSAYEPLRATCQALRSVLHPDIYAEPAPEPPPPPKGTRLRDVTGCVLPPPESYEDYTRRRAVIEAAEALALSLVRLDGTIVPTQQVFLEDLSPTHEERARLRKGAPTPSGVLTVVILPLDDTAPAAPA